MSTHSTPRKIPISLSLTAVQCTACAVILLITLIVRLVGGNLFIALRTLFKEALTDTSVMQTLSDGVGGTTLSVEETAVTQFAEIFSSAKAALPIPYGTLSSPFGYRNDPFTNERGFHSGVDIAAPQGTDIVTLYAGTVVEASYHDRYGKYMRIKHDNEIETLYAHCSVLHKRVGDSVQAGEVIAEVGNTGYSTGNHLHLELKHAGIYYNPITALPNHPYA